MKDFIECIKDNAKKYPNRIAVIDGERKISYADFFNLVNSISHQLIVNNSKPKIAFDLKQGIEGYALIVAVLNVGGIYCPINPNDPIDKKNHIINEFAPDFIVVESEEKILEIKSDKAIIFSKLHEIENTLEIIVDYKIEDIIYVIYTSGTTGMPKGVKICRKALNKFLEWSIPTYAVNENDIWGQFSFLSFDLSIVDIFTCLCSGATLYVICEDSNKSLPASVIDKAKITIWHSSPEVIKLMMKREKTKPSSLSSLRLMSFCGAPLTKSHVEFLFSKCSNLKIFNTYGPTEGTLFCTWQLITSLNYNRYCNYTVSLGKPIEGWHIYFQQLNDLNEFEVIIYGEHIGRGYTRHISDSGFGEINIEGKIYPSYTTGDIVLMDNNNIYFSSRKDRQVKINGNRVELAGIEYHVQNYLGFNCVVIFHDNKLFCFIETDEEIDKNSIMEFLLSKLMQYEIPKIYIPISNIPKTPNSKIDVDNLIKLTEEWIQ